MLYNVIYDANNNIVEDISYNSQSTDNLDVLDDKNNLYNNPQCNKILQNEDNNAVEEYIIKNDKKYIESMIGEWIENTKNK